MKANFLLNIIHERALLICWKRMNFYVIRSAIITRAQITNSARTLSKFRLCMPWLSIKFFSCELLTSNNMISLASWCNKHFFKGSKFYFLCGLVKKHHRDLRQWYPYQKLGLLANFVEHCTGIAEVMSSNPL